MNGQLSSIHAGDDAPVVVLFGGSQNRRHEMLSLLQAIGGITAYGALSEAEGMDLLRDLPRVELVLIGGRYEESQRARIRAYVQERLPGTKVTEPGHDYPYSNEAILTHVTRLLEHPSNEESHG